MKKLFFALAILVTGTTEAQIKFYKDTTFTQAYTLLTSPASANNGLFWDDDDFVMPIGFNFKFFGDSSNTLYHSGTTLATGGQFSLKPVSFSSQFVSLINLLGSDLRDRDTTGSGSSKSPISYQTVGSSPNRIFKLQFQNAGFGNAISNGQYNDSLSIQLWLHETSNMIDIRFGPSNFVSSNMDLWDGGPGAFIGIFDSINYQSASLPVKKSYFLNGNATAPFRDSSITTFTAIITPPGLSGNPSNGRVYRFMPAKASATPNAIKETWLNGDFDMAYHPGQEEIQINTNLSDRGLVQVFDLNGRQLLTEKLNSSYTRVNLQNLSNGMYIVRWSNGQQNKTLKLIR